MPNPFYILNVTPDTPTDEIKKSYYNLAKLYHPDVFVGDKETALEKMQELNWAYETLQDNTLFIQYSKAFFADEQRKNYQEEKKNQDEEKKKENEKSKTKPADPPKPRKRNLKPIFACISCLLAAGLVFVIVYASKQTNITVYITDSGSKYHRKTCGSLSKSCHAIELSKAVQKGYEPCLKCKPPTEEKKKKKEKAFNNDDSSDLYTYYDTTSEIAIPYQENAGKSKVIFNASNTSVTWLIDPDIIFNSKETNVSSDDSP